MIIMKLKLDNFFAFKDFDIDMSYPKKLVRTPIEHESLSGYPNFRYKKVNIILGSNASGKTTLGKAMRNILNFIAFKNVSLLEQSILDVSARASFMIDFIVRERKLNRIMLDIIPDGDGKRRYEFSYDKETIRSRDSYQSCAARLDERGRTIMDYNSALDSVEKLGWLFSYPEEKMRTGESKNRATQLRTLNAILKSLDPSISTVRLLDDVKDTSFVVEKDGREILLQNGALTTPEVFSSGTRDGIAVAGFLAGIMDGLYGLYYCDEHFSYIHSSIEKRILGLMISNLGEDEQLFFTSHNETLMEENLPKHSFTFLVRADGRIKALYANDFVPKQSDNLRRAVENDVIRILPDDSYLDQLED